MVRFVDRRVRISPIALGHPTYTGLARMIPGENLPPPPLQHFDTAKASHWHRSPDIRKKDFIVVCLARAVLLDKQEAKLSLG